MPLNLTQAIYLFLAAVVAGVLNSVAGGGSFVAFPTLLFVGVPPVQANATNTVALWPGLAAGTLAYWKRLNAPLRLLIPLLIASVAGGWGGAVLLLHTPQQLFVSLIPWLLLVGTLLFAFGNSLRALAGKSAAADLETVSGQTILFAVIAALLVSVYGGYFGAGLGFMLMGLLAMMGMSDINAMAAIRTLLSAAINAAAVVTFIAARAVLWPQCVVMIAGSLAGGWFGARFAQKADPKKVRGAVICIGVAMTVYFFVTKR